LNYATRSSYQAVIWSAINLKLLCALWEITAEDGGIPVQLGYEPDNPADSKAVIVTISTYTLRCLLGADLISVPANDTTEPKTAHWRLGYTSAGQSQAVTSYGSHSNSGMIYWMLGWRWRGATGGCESARHVRRTLMIGMQTYHSDD
jgi:hypothetical protein